MLSDQARNNTIENFSVVFEKKFLQTVIARVDANEEILKEVLDDDDFRAALGESIYARSISGCVSERPRCLRKYLK
jgi:hypothetical protein